MDHLRHQRQNHTICAYAQVPLNAGRNNVRSDGAIGRIGPGDRHSAVAKVFLYHCNEGDTLVELINGMAYMTIDRNPICLQCPRNLMTGSKTCRDMLYAPQ